MISKCNREYCPGSLKVLVIGLIMFFVAVFNANADVRVDMIRELPNETQHVVRTFDDREDFEMWLDMRLDDGGCDPYVTKMNITMDNSPNLD